jgi:Ca2+-binding EF-hand superfamily protein
MRGAAVKHPAGAFIAVSLMFGSSTNAQQARKPASAANAGPTAVPVPRTDFIQTMDIEFRKMDTNRNNILTKTEIEQFQRGAIQAEARARVHALFAQLDSDKNGQLSAAEFASMPVTVASANAAPILGQHDLNRDGTITLVEYRTAKLANFDRMDADKDGIVSVAEMKAAGLVK